MSEAKAPPAGLEARDAAVRIVDGVLHRGTLLDVLVDAPFMPADPRERALARMIAATTLRRHGALNAVLDTLLEKPLDAQARRVNAVLLTALAQIFLMEVKDHAAVDLAVTLTGTARDTRRFRGLVNAVLRNAIRRRAELAPVAEDPMLAFPGWLTGRWSATYGEDRARRIVESLLHEPALDLSVKTDPQGWAERLGGVALANGTVRLLDAGNVTALDGYDDGAWWVQDAASRMPVLLLGDIASRAVVDLCAAPGGKTAQMAAAGAIVTAVDRSAKRMERLAANMERVGLAVETAIADATTWRPDTPPDVVLLDAPCSATGTIRRHPDLPHLKAGTDIAKLADLQARLIDNAAAMLRPGGTLVYSTCSLEPEEGEAQVARFLSAHPDFARRPVTPGEVPGFEAAVTPDGDLRITPDIPDAPAGTTDPRLAGSAGFFAARLEKQA